MAVDFERCREVPGTIDQAHPMRRIFMQHGDARIVEAPRNDDALQQQSMSLDEGAADQTMRDHHQRAVHPATPACDEGECIGDARWFVAGMVLFLISFVVFPITQSRAD